MKASSHTINPTRQSNLLCNKKSCRRLWMTIMLAACFTGYGGTLQAQQPVTYKQELDGAAGQLAKDSSRTVIDSVLVNPGAFPPVDTQASYTISNMIVFHINESSLIMLPDSFKVELTIKVYFTNQNNVSDSTPEKKLNIDYYNSGTYHNKAVYYFGGAKSVTVKVIDIRADYPALAVILPLLKVENRMVVRRTFDMDCDNDAITTVSHNTATVSTKGELQVSWPGLNAAQEYDLEWTFIDQSALDAGWYNSSGSADPEKLFRNNATRVTIQSNSYHIPLLYEGDGRLFYRVRAAQTTPGKERKVTAWSSGFTAQGGLGEYAFSGHERSLNWQASTSFAEGGKRKSVVQYFDGTLRGRQTVTKDNTTDTTLVAETFYDKQGRAVIEVLPAPTLSSLIGYTPLFNQARSGGMTVENTPGVYDTIKTAADYCDFATPPLDSVSGAARYYSYNNPNKLNLIHKFLPQAKGYPFSEVKYTPDNTGRIASQGGVGPQFQLGSGHETRYYYGTPLQSELDALFGTEAGIASHYQKNMVRDANGQYSVSYVDMHGRTVATALAGAVPDSLQALPSYRDSLQTDTLLTPVNNVIKDNTITSVSTLLVTTAGVDSFFYRLNPESLQLSDKDAVDICYDCLYDLEITIADDCNNQHLPNDELFVYRKSNMRVQPPVYDTTCTPADDFNVKIGVHLEEGSYVVTKKLTLRSDAQAYYRDSLYAPHHTVQTREDIIAGQLTRIREQRGNDCMQEGEPWYVYQQYRDQMLLDMTPPFGQYANYPRNPVRFSIFKTESGIPVYSKVSYPYSSDEPNPAMLAPEQFIYNFKPAWAEALLPLHPEYCMLQGYEQYKSAYHWDADFETTDTYQQALVKGYLNPTNLASSPASGFGNGNDSMFYGGANSSSKNWLSDSLTNYKVIDGKTYSLWAVASIMGHCDPTDEACVNSFYNTPGNTFNPGVMGCEGELDMAWRFFRNEYLRLKHKRIDNLVRSICQPVISDSASPVFLSEADAIAGAGDLLNGDLAAAQQAAADSLSNMAERACLAYAESWWRQLETCQYSPADSANIIHLLVEVCKEGSDSTHPFGASSVRPESHYQYRSFDEAITQYNAGIGKSNNAACNAYLIDAPAPYNRPVLAAEQPLYTKPDDCTCEKIGALKTQYEAATGYSSFSDYVQKTLHTNISQGSLDSLLNLCNGNIACRYIAKPLALPPALQCTTGYDVCADCNTVSSIYNTFKAAFPGIIPTYEEITEQQQGNNRLFANYMNNKLGFSKPAQEYLAFMDSCGVSMSPCDSLEKIITDFKTGYSSVQSVTNPDTVHFGVTLPFQDDIRILKEHYSNIFKDGIAHVSPEMVAGTSYDIAQMVIQKNDTLCVNNNFSIEARVRGDSATHVGSQYCKTLNFIFWDVNSQVCYSPTFQMHTIAPGKSCGAGTHTCEYGTWSDPANRLEYFRDLMKWTRIKMSFRNDTAKIYVNDTLISSIKYSIPITKIRRYAFGIGAGYVDYVKVWDSTGKLTYVEEFEDCQQSPANYPPELACDPDCATRFTNYFNQQKGTSYTYEQIDSVYFNTCGRHLDVCGSTAADKESLRAIMTTFNQAQNPYRGRINLQSNRLNPPLYIAADERMISNGHLHWPKAIRDSTGRGWVYYQQLTAGGGSPMCVENGYSFEFRFKSLKKLSNADDVYYVQGGNIHFVLYRRSTGSSPGFFLRLISERGTSPHTLVSSGMALMDSDPDVIFKEWCTIKATVTPTHFRIYYNGNLVKEVERPAGASWLKTTAFTHCFYDYQVMVDWFKTYDGNGNLVYFEDFNDPYNRAAYAPDFICTTPTPSCEQRFTTYFNQQKATSYTFSQVDSIYTAAGLALDVCGTDTASIRCDQLENYVQEYKDRLGRPASGYVDLDMRTFAGNKTPDEGPKGVFDVKGKLLGNTADSTPTAVKQSFVQIWNSSADNRQVGTLSLLETGKFRLILNPGKQAPKEGIVGQRYYQVDAITDVLDGLLTGTGTYIDFGDSTGAKVNNRDSTSSTVTKSHVGPGEVETTYPDPKIVYYFYTKHFYNYSASRTVTVYHSDFKGLMGFDCSTPANCGLFSNIKNLRGYFPQDLTRVTFHTTQDSTINSFANIKNFDKVTSIQYFDLQGHVGNTGFRNNRFSSFERNHELKDIIIDNDASVSRSEIRPINEYFPDLPGNFPELASIRIRPYDTLFAGKLDFTLPNLRALHIQNAYISSSFVLTTQKIDEIINQVAAGAQHNNGTLTILPYGTTARSAASDNAVALLTSKGWTLTGAGMNNVDTPAAFKTPFVSDTLPWFTPFTDFINAKFNTTLTAAQVDSLYLARCGHKPNWYDTTNGSFPAGLLLCGKNEPVSPTLSYEEVYDPPCSDSSILAFNSGTEIFTMYKDSLNNIFDSLYTAQCLGAAALEQFSVKHHVSEYHYTLYYYDQAGNLVKTVAPAGVNPNHNSTWLAEVAEKRKLGETQVPAHTMPTVYRYNSLNQVVSQKTPDAGKSTNWYDRLGRLAVSQNAEQAIPLSIGGEGLRVRYSYTMYDPLGRITEVGQKPQSTAMTQTISRSPGDLADWLFYNNNGAGGAEMVTQTVYDHPGIDATACIEELRFTQKPYTLRNRVSYTRYYEKPSYYNGGDGRYYISGQSYTTGVDYSYDIHGNVDTMRNLYGSMQYGPMAHHGYNACKTIAYTYDLISGKVNEVHYNPGQNDEFYHRYEYDAENRLTDVYTTDNKLFIGQQGLEEHDAYYTYYRHGPLARTELGQMRVQGLDYNYTLQGWLKGINASAVRPNSDPGLDGGGFTSYPNRYVGRDLFGLTLNYFRGDYAPINPNSDPYPDFLPYLPVNRQYNALYNGNISSMMFSMPLRFNPHLYHYKYDQLNRLVSMDVSRYFSSNDNHWQYMSATDLHMEKYSYDANGNIKTVLRNGYLSENMLMDSLTYFYTPGTNRLDHIRDQYFGSTAHNSNYIPRIDLKDQPAGSYTYDAIGNLKSSAWMGDDLIKWNIYGKVTEVEKRALSGINSRYIHYYYDPSGNKTGETARYGSGSSAYYNHRWYVRDAQGNVLATYEVNNAANAAAGTLKLAEHHMYGSSRLGVISRSLDMDEPRLTAVEEDNLGNTYLLTFTRGEKLFEVTNHLGDVVLVLADLRTGIPTTGNPSLVAAYNAVMVNAADYTPFGRLMAGRVHNTSWNYRYGFNGKEYDKEVQGTGNLLDYGNRLYDPMVGRFLSVDPLTKSYPELSPYQYASNSPIENSDLDGNESISKTQHGLARKFEAEIQMKTAQQNAYEQKIRHFTNPSNSPQVPPPPYLKPSPNFSPTEKTNLQVLFNINLQNEGYNYDLTKKPGTKLLDNKTYQNFSNNIALPTLEIASYISGLGEASALLKLSRPITSTAKRVSPNVQRVLNAIDDFKAQGGAVKLNPLNPTQEINMTFQKGAQKLDFRIETHPLPKKFGGDGVAPQRHMNVDLYPDKKVLPNSGHKILE